MDVSVVMPAYRAAGFIWRAIDSALSQADVSVEVVVVDDACPDHTGDRVEERYHDTPLVRVVRLPANGGPGVARNAGFKAARGRWIAVLDADDAFEPGRLRRMLDQAAEFGADVVGDNVRVYDAATGSLSEPKLKSLTVPGQLDVYSFVDGSRPGRGDLDLGLLKPIFNRARLARLGTEYPDDVRHGEDFEFYLAVIRAGARFFVVPEAGYLWTSRQSGMSQTLVDYSQQVVRVRLLQADPVISADHRLVQLLEQRAAALVKFQITTRYANAIHAGKFGHALAMCIRHPHLLRLASRSLTRKLRST